MRTHPLHRLDAAENIRNHDIVVVRVKPAFIPHLAASIGVERRVIEHHLHAFARACLRNAHPVFNNGQHLALLRSCFAVAFKNCFRQARGKQGSHWP